MLGWFRSPPFVDASLGELRRSGGYWRGAIALAGVGSVPLVVAGSRRAPHPDALALARDAGSVLANGRASIERAVFEHVQPYVDAIASGELAAPPEALPSVASPGDVWPHVSFLYVSVAPLGGTLVTEFGLRIPWDEEHTLGARFTDHALSELCGSVLRP